MSMINMEIIKSITSHKDFFYVISLLFTAFISIKSFKMSKESLRLSLYNRRFGVYQSILKYSRVFIMGNVQELQNSDIESNFYLAFRESKNLFKDDSGVYKIIENIKKNCNYINSAQSDTNKNELITIEKHSLEKNLHSLESALKIYLKFN